jgi:hypothetical protein
MMESKNITVNIEIHGTLDADVICEEVRWHLRREIAEANADIEKWAKIGRKPGELKVGDIVRRSPGYYDIVANPQGGLRLDEGEELVVPVEARFDL